MGATDKQLVGGIVFALAMLLAPWTARADVVPSCGPGQRWQARPPPSGGFGHSGACEYDPAPLAAGGACCIAAVLVLAAGQWLVLRRARPGGRGTSSREP